MRQNCLDTNGNFDIYSAYVDNLRIIQYSIDDSFRNIKTKIANKKNDDEINSNTKLLVLLLGIWSEARLEKLINERSIFNKREIQLIESEKTKINQWKLIIELSFRKHYNIYFGDELTKDNLNHMYTKYNNLMNYVDNYLQSIIEVRNKLAHGQWICQPNKNKTNQNTNINIQQLQNENYLSLEKKYQILNYLTQIIHDLVVSPTTFTRDFKKNYNEIKNRIDFIDNHLVNKYILEVQKIIDKKNNFRNSTISQN
jgi:hypothetical protein